jgi:AraC-like DNA-binding protein
MQVLPSIELFPYIKHYLFLRSERKGIKKLRLFSDGNTGIVFTFRNPLISNYKNFRLPYKLPDTFLYGQLTEYKDIFLLGETSLIIVVFQPSGVHQLLGLPADRLIGNIINLEDLFGRKGTDLQEKLVGQTNIQDKVDILNAFFAAIVKRKIFDNHVIIQASLELINKNMGLVSVNQLVKYTGYTAKHIERKFVESIGLNPKMFCSIVRLHGFLKFTKEKSSNETITLLAYEAGYSDQSHLVKDFCKYTGMTPGEYINKTTKLTVNFIEYLYSEITLDHAMSNLYNF